MADKSSGEASFPFSYPQKSLWYDGARFSYPGAYQLHAIIRLARASRRDDLAAAYQAVLQRHSLLTARVDDSAEEPIWRAGSPTGIDFYPPIWKDEAEREKAIQRYLDEPLPIDGPLFRASVWEDGSAGQTIILKWHHLVADAWSFPILFRDFWLFLGDPASAVSSAPAPSYGEYCERNLRYPGTAKAEADLRYWSGELEGLEPFRGLPLSRPMENQPSGRGSDLVFPLEAAGRLPEGSTLFEFCLAAYAVLLSGLSGRSEVCVAVPLLGRPNREERRMVGHFVNLAAIRLRTEGGQAFSGLLSQTREKLSSALERQAYPFFLLAEKLDARRPPGHPPLTDAYCGMIKLPRFPDGEVEVEAIGQKGAAWPLSLEILQGKDGDRAVMRYPIEAWDEGDIREIGELYMEAFRRALESPSAPLSELLAAGRDRMDALRSRAAASRTETEPKAPRPPETESQKRILEIWKEVLGGDGIGIDDDFFAAGGHSLMAAQVMSRIRAVYGKRLPLGTLFRLRNAAALAEYIDSLPEEEPDEDPVVARPAPATGTNRWPLSFSQSRLWFLNRLEPESQAYNMHISLRVKGAIDPALVDQAFRDLQARHESLRTTFHEHQGEPVQVIHAEPFVRMEFIDLCSRAPGEAEDTAKRLSAEHAGRPYDLSVSALRFMAIQVAPGDLVLSLGMHHVIGDQWSWGVISRDLTACFSARAAGSAPSLPPLAIQYRDYADWQVRNLDSKAMRRAGSYWKAHLAGLPILELPLDRPRPRIMSNSGGVVRGRFSEGDIQAIQDLARGRGCTPYIALLACFAVLLHRYTGMEDLPIGTPTANRDRKEFEDLIGTFVNTLALRIRVRGDDSFADLMDRTREEFLEAYEYRAYPFEKLVSDLNPTRDSSHLPLAQVLFNLVNAPIELPFGDKAPVEGFPIEPGGSQFDLSVSVDLRIARQAEFFFNRDILDEESVRGMRDAYMLIIREAVAAPETKVSAFPLMSDLRRAAILDGWNATDRPYDFGKGVALRLWESARRNAGKTAARFEEGEYSYERLFSAAFGIAERLKGMGIGEGDIVGIHLNRGPKLVSAMLAALASGAAYLPVDPAYPDARKGYMLAHSGARVLITEEGLESAGLEAGGFARLTLDALPEHAGMGEPFPASPDSPAYLLYTSGSTGKPKGVVIPRRALDNFLLSMRESPGMGPAESLLSVTPVSFDISGLEIYLPLLSGGTLVMPPREKAIDPAELARIISDESIGIMQATPATWRMLLEYGWRGSVGTILCGGEAFPQELIEPLLGRCERLWNMYGPTETTIWSTLYRVTKREFPVPIGKPIANTVVYVLDQGMAPVPPGVVGDIYIGGTGLALGYRDSPEQTRAAFLPDPWRQGQRIYRTGDRGRFKSDGNLEYAGRADGQIKLNGHRIELGEIEAALCGMPGIKQAVCLLKELAPGDARLAAYLVPEKGAFTESAAEAQGLIDAHLSGLLPAYMLPQAYAFIETVPLTPSGKVDRKALPEMTYARKEPVQPADETERALRSIWELTLNASGIGVEDDFFQLGGHSLLAVRLTAAISKEYGIDIPLRSFFSEPTVRGCARLVRRHLGGSAVVGENPAAGLSPDGLVGVPPRIGAKRAFESDIIFPMSLNGTAPPVFLVAGVFADENGLYRYLSSLARHLGASLPIYCLRPRGLLKPAEPYGSVREVALEYIRALKAVKPNGPYRLIGECVGGIVAYEMARLLSSAGEIVESLILMDTEYPHTARRKLALLLARSSNKLKRAAAAAFRMLFDPAGARREIRGALERRKRRLFPRTRSEIDQLRFERVQRNFARLARRYKVLPYPNEFHLLVNEENMRIYPYLGWRDPLSGENRREVARLSASTVTGDHVSRLTVYGKETSEAIMRILGRNETSSS